VIGGITIQVHQIRPTEAMETCMLQEQGGREEGDVGRAGQVRKMGRDVTDALGNAVEIDG
jgi:hypothetical protein